jgi:hypothetical protein
MKNAVDQEIPSIQGIQRGLLYVVYFVIIFY